MLLLQDVHAGLALGHLLGVLKRYPRGAAKVLLHHPGAEHNNFLCGPVLVPLAAVIDSWFVPSADCRSAKWVNLLDTARPMARYLIL